MAICCEILNINQSSITTTTTRRPVTTTTTKKPSTTTTTTKSTTSNTTKKPKIVKLSNNNLSNDRLNLTFTDGTKKTIGTGKKIKSVVTDYQSKKVTVTYTDNTIEIY